MSIYLHEVEADAQLRCPQVPPIETAVVQPSEKDAEIVTGDERESDAEQCN